MYKVLESLDAFKEAIQKNEAVLVYFSHDKCNVCHVLKPKVEELITSTFSEIKLFYANTVNQPEIAAQLSVFTVPTLLIFFDGKEFYRKSRNIGIVELEEELRRPYELMFS